MASTAPARPAGADELAAAAGGGNKAAAAAAARPVADVAAAADDRAAAAPAAKQQQQQNQHHLPLRHNHHQHKSSGGGSGFARLLAAAFSGGGSEARRPSLDGSSSSAGGSGTRTPPLSERVPLGLSAGGVSLPSASLGGKPPPSLEQQQAKPPPPQRRRRTSAAPFWRLGDAPEPGRGARVERHASGGPAGGVVQAGPWGEPGSLEYFPRVGVRTYTDGVQGPGQWGRRSSSSSSAAGNAHHHPHNTASANPANADNHPDPHDDDYDGMTPLGRLVAVASLLAYVGIGHCCLASLISVITHPLSLRPWTIFLLAAATLLFPAAPLYLRSIHLSPLMRCWRRYFRFSYVFETRLDQSRPYVVAQFPHGAFPLGQIVGGSFMACEFEQHTMLGLAATAVFLVPGWRHINSWFGALPATSHNFRRLLRRCTRAARGEAASEGARQETEAVVAGARAASAAHEEAARVAAAEEEERREDEEAEAQAAEQAQQQQARLAPLTQQQQHHLGRHRSPSPARRAAAAGAAGRPTSAPPSGSPVSGPFASPRATRAVVASLLGGAGNGVGVGSPAAAFGAAAVLPLPRLEATVSAPPVRLADVERAAMLARLRRADSILSDPGARALAGRGLSDDDDESSSLAGSGGSGSGSSAGGSCYRGGSAELSSDPSVINVGGSPPPLLEGEEEQDGEVEEEAMVAGAEQQQQQQGQPQPQPRVGAGAGGLRRRRPAAIGGGDPVAALLPSSLTPGSPRAAVPAPPATPSAGPGGGGTGRSPSGGGAGAAAGSRPGTAGAGHHHHHGHGHRDHHPLPHVPVPANLLPPCLPPDYTSALGPFPKYRHPGTSVAVMVGGIAEMFMLRRDAEVLKLRSRKGFVRLALEHGTDILPTYMFGNSTILDFGPRWLQKTSRKIRVSLGFMYGPLGLPVPWRVPILMVVGAPVKAGPAMAPTDPGFEARVDEIHAAVCLEIARVYYRWRGEYGWADRPLIIG
jgi:hypothetical protein